MTRSPSPPWVLLLGLATIALLHALAWLRLAPPAPLGAEAPETEFSAARARDVLERLAGDQAAHPVGSAANAAVRARVEAELRRLGLEPRLQEAWAGAPRTGQLARVANVWARLPGGSGPAVLLAAHYDSVPAGPGVSDDLVGVAALLEAARALLAAGPLPRPILLLIDDGEEAGLLGARAAVRDPAFAAVREVINLEARGTGGPSLMFQTGPDDAALLRLFAGAAPRPFATSLYAEVYRLLPNDTDMTVFLEEGRTGFNLGFIAGVERYHTPHDDLAHADLGSLQHHGQNALALARALALAPAEPLPPGRASYFDVLGLFVCVWPAGWTLPLAVLALLGVLAAGAAAVRRGEPGRGLAWGALVPLALPLLGGAASAGLVALLQLGGHRAPWTAWPEPATWACRGLAWGVGGLPLALLARRAGPWGLWTAAWGGAALAGCLLAWLLPGAAYLLVVPALTAALGAWSSGAPLRPADPVRHAVASWAPLLALGLLWAPLLHGLDWAFGLGLSPVAGLLAGVLLVALSPLAPGEGRLRWAPAAAGLALALLGGVTGALAPRYDPDRPLRLNLRYHLDADRGVGRWLAGPAAAPLPAPLAAAAPFAATAAPAFPYAPRGERWFAAAAPAEPLPAPELELLGREELPGGRRLRLRLRSPRGASCLRLFLPGGCGLRRLDSGGVSLGPIPDRVVGWLGGHLHYGWVTAPPEGVEATLELRGTAPVEAVLVDHGPGLPAAGLALTGARPAWAAPSQDGDQTLVTRRVLLP